MNTKKLLIVLIILSVLTVSNFSLAKGSMIANAVGIMHEISSLADDFNLTKQQKTEIKSVLMDYLPNIALKTTAMINNRHELLESSRGKDEIEEEFLLNIADKQGLLLTGLIIAKERMKKDIRNVLTEEQKDFVNALIDTVIQYKLDHH